MVGYLYTFLYINILLFVTICMILNVYTNILTCRNMIVTILQRDATNTIIYLKKLFVYPLIWGRS